MTGGGTTARRGVQKLLEALQLHAVSASLTIRCALPIGHGRASSSADLLAALRATLSALGRSWTPAQISAFASSIEATNPTLLTGCALFRQRTGQLLGRAPGLDLRGLPVGYQMPLCTRSHHRSAPPWTSAHRREAARARQEFEDALHWREPALLLRAATRSACLAATRHATGIDVQGLLHQARERGAAGISISHSGTGGVLWFVPWKTP